MYYRQIKRKGRIPLMDYINIKNGLQMYGKSVNNIKRKGFKLTLQSVSFTNLIVSENFDSIFCFYL